MTSAARRKGAAIRSPASHRRSAVPPVGRNAWRVVLRDVAVIGALFLAEIELHIRRPIGARRRTEVGARLVAEHPGEKGRRKTADGSVVGLDGFVESAALH